MVHRKTYPADDNCEIAVTTERLADGWAIVVSLRHHTEGAERITDLPVPTERFATEEEAEAFGVARAREYLERNTPRAA
jgi:hypothetical protein